MRYLALVGKESFAYDGCDAAATILIEDFVCDKTFVTFILEENPMAKDPVCGMDVNEETAAGKSEFKGKTYYFCSPGCKTAFDKDPDKYVSGEAAGSHHHH